MQDLGRFSIMATSTICIQRKDLFPSISFIIKKCFGKGVGRPSGFFLFSRLTVLLLLFAEAEMSDLEQEYPDFTTPDDMCSVTLLLEGQKVYVHREVLAAWSPVFRSMFTRNFKGTVPYELPTYSNINMDIISYFCTVWTDVHCYFDF